MVIYDQKAAAVVAAFINSESYITVCLAAAGRSQMEGYNYQTNGWHKQIKHNLRFSSQHIRKNSKSKGTL